MGLDMYLERLVYIDRESNVNIDARKKNGERININREKIRYIKEDYAYWRKANQIHKWFVDNVQNGEDDCKEYSVSGNTLKQLVKLCEEVLKNKDKAEELLPTQDGFFFGSTEYDELYFDQVRETIEQLEGIGPDDIFIYCSSW